MTNSVTQVLGISKPIIQGPMFWLTNAQFVAAVSNAGGLGVLGISAGQYQPTNHDSALTLAHMREQIRLTKQLTTKPFGLNLVFKDNPDTDRHALPLIKMMIEEEVPVAVINSTRYIDRWFTMLKDHHIKIVFRPATPEKAVVEEAAAKGVDVLVATGFDEGGTIPTKAVGTFPAIPYVVDIVNGRVPVMAAGGIVDARTTRAAFALGAAGVFVGTAFLATTESPMADNIKADLVKYDAFDEVLFNADPGLYRSIPGKLPSHLAELSYTGATHPAVWKQAGRYGGMREGMLLGDLDHGYASFGLGMSFIHQVSTVADVVDRLYAGVPETQR